MNLFRIIIILLFFIFPNQVLTADFNFTKNYKLKIFDDTDDIIKKKEITQEFDIGVSTEVNLFLNKAENNNFKEIIIATQVKATQFPREVRTFLYSYFFKHKDGLFKKNQNQNLNLKKKSNAIVVQDFDLVKYLENDKDDFKEIRLGLKNFLSENSINVPKNSLRSDHLYLKSNGSMFFVTYIYNYSVMNKSLNSDVSKFYPSIINDNKKHNEFMNNWISLSIKRHDIFQNSLNISSKSKIDFTDNGFNLDNDLDYFRNVFFENENVQKKNESSKSNLKKVEEEKQRLKQEKLEAQKKAEEEKQRLEQEKLEAQKKAEEEKQRLEQEKLEAQKKAEEEKQRLKQEKLEAQKKTEEEKQSSTSNDLDGQIKRLKEINELYKSGLIDAEELKLLKSKILSN